VVLTMSLNKNIYIFKQEKAQENLGTKIRAY